jgi:hypothetical protein
MLCHDFWRQRRRVLERRQKDFSKYLRQVYCHVLLRGLQAAAEVKTLTQEEDMLRHSGSARDPFDIEKSSSSSTPGMGWVVVGFVVICAAVAAFNLGGPALQQSVAHIAGSIAHQG